MLEKAAERPHASSRDFFLDDLPALRGLPAGMGRDLDIASDGLEAVGDGLIRFREPRSA